MKSQFLVGLGWMTAALALYADLLLLELDWNLRSWQPALDGFAVGLILGLPAVLVVFWFLARTGMNRINRTLSCIVCLGLAALAIYISAREAMTEGMFARETTSPFWYRGSRFAVLGLPGAFWVGQLWRRHRKRETCERKGQG